MSIKILLLIAMVFCHIVDDYYLQGWLASAKQKDWWTKNAPNPLYKYDYIIALFMHSFSWSFMVCLIPAIYSVINNLCITNIIITFLSNVFIHMFVDNEKANKKTINLIMDQLIHMGQIILTWLLVMFA